MTQRTVFNSRFVPLLAILLLTGGTLAAQRRAEPLPCPECHPPQRFWFGFLEIMAVQAIPSTINNVLRDAEWAKINPHTWATNLENPWQWDNNAFLNNQFSHPYHGNLYFNAGRSNGYNFWASSLWAFGGSLMWEEFMEAWAPAPNDWFNTSLGGITLGEMFHRVTNLVLDNTTKGPGRMWREIGGTLLNPVNGFSRLVHGQMNDVTANPPDWRPSKVWGSVDAGYQTSSGSTSKGALEGTRDQGIFRFELDYGDEILDLSKTPFSAFHVEAEVTTNHAPKHALSELTAYGNLWGKTLSRSKTKLHQLAAYITYEYLSSPAIEYGGQGFMFGIVSRMGDVKRFRVETSLLGTAMPVAALQSDYYYTIEGRDYDYGLGFGGIARARAMWGRTAELSARGRYLWTPVLSGFNGDHYQAAGYFDGRIYARQRLGVGASLVLYHRSSNYDQYPDVTTDGTLFRVYASYAFPRFDP
ncbi:MAG TPA: DUF3943 domain-containing protein [Gemmatimonadales bacterium]|nr:DUF3943 domain-containing protein [Gemmatimonadales bacterium]